MSQVLYVLKGTHLTGDILKPEVLLSYLQIHSARTVYFTYRFDTYTVQLIGDSSHSVPVDLHI
jgi:hypothetical protein